MARNSLTNLRLSSRSGQLCGRYVSEQNMNVSGDDQAATVCVPCKRRKKRCDKLLPACSRCTRFNTQCSYAPPTKDLASLSEAVPENAVESAASSSNVYYELQDLGDIAAMRLRSLVARMSPRGAEDYKTYFTNFHIYMPIINEEDFYWRLRNSTPPQYMSALMLAMTLCAQLSSKADDALERAMKIYPTLKVVYSHCFAVAAPVQDFIQAGVLIASFEHCQGLHKEAWLTIGGCARMGHILRQQEIDSMAGSMMDVEDTNPRSALWYSIAVLERIISADYLKNKLPHASKPPRPTDVLPVTIPEDVYGLTVGHNMFLAEEGESDDNLALRTSPFTTLSPFATTVQATYLSNLVTEHVLRGSTDPEIRQKATTKLDLILQSYGGALIPPAGQAVGHYCGAFGIRTCVLFYLHEEELKLAIEVGNEEQATRSTAALRSLTRLVIYATKASGVGLPLDLDSIAFWSHKIVYHAAMCHIRYAIRDQEWGADLQVCRSYLRYFTPRYKLHCDYLHEIEAEDRKTSRR